MSRAGAHLPAGKHLQLQETLAPGESITVTVYIKMEHAGQREFRVGLVAGGFRFIDDNAFRTKIMVGR